MAYKKIDQYDDKITAGLMNNYRESIALLGEDPDREGLQKTPERIAKAMQFLTQGYSQDAYAILESAKFHDGHNYELLITIKGKVNENTGFLFDVKKLSELIKVHVLDILDHRNLNLDVEFLRGKICSTENLAMGIWNQLVPHLPEEVTMHCIKLYETPRIYVEYFGE